MIWTPLLVPALLGLKGNLEMTLASRLSTAANLGILDDQKKAKEIAKANLALIQIQGVVVGGLAAIFALLVGWIPQLKYFSLFHLLSREPLEISMSVFSSEARSSRFTFHESVSRFKRGYQLGNPINPKIDF